MMFMIFLFCICSLQTIVLCFNMGIGKFLANATAIHHLAALPQSGVHSVMNSSLPRKVTPTALPGNVPKLQTVKVR